jgi:methionyl-tRNA synthetase
MSEKILITSALPYANGSIHLGHLVEYIQADIYSRFLKLNGRDVTFVCADDTHGTPIYIKAKSLNLSPEELIEKYNEEHQLDFKDFQIEFDYYYSTHSPENEKHAQYIYNALHRKGHIQVYDVQQYYCKQDQMFLSDRFIKGTCPNCGTNDQYGDICENCGLHYEATELVAPHCALCNSIPVIKSSKHFFFKLSDFSEQLIKWTSEAGHLQTETLNSIRGWLKDGLKDWDISRDAPYFGFKIPGEESKYFYVWLDAPVGYIATTEKYCAESGKDFNSYWHDENTRIYHFIGKDIIYFHTLFWPAMLMGSGYNLPHSVFVHGFLTVNGKKMSKTRGTFITARTYLEFLDPQCLRYYYASKLSSNSDDIDLNLQDFQSKVNADLVNNIINIGSRSVSMLNKHFNGLVGEMSDEENKTFSEFVIKAGVVQKHYEERDFSKAVAVLLEISNRVNKYFTDSAPWKFTTTDPECVQQVCTFALNSFKLIAVLLKPVLPKLVAEIEMILHIGPQQWKDAVSILPRNHKISIFTQLLSRVEVKDIENMIASINQSSLITKAN